MPWKRLSRAILGTELKLLSTTTYRNGYLWQVEKLRGSFEVCPKCATSSNSRYGYTYVLIRQESLWQRPLWLKIKKHRYYCKPCRKPFYRALTWYYASNANHSALQKIPTESLPAL